MMPIPPQLAKLAASTAFKYGSKALIALAVLAGLWYMQHAIYSNGYDAGVDKTSKKWLEREAKINAEQEEFLKLKQHENDLIQRQNHEKYTNAIEQYVDYSQKLERDLNDNRNQRLRVRAKCPSGSGDTMPRKAEISKTDTGRGETTEWTELAAEDSQAVWQTARDAGALAQICQQALFFIESNGMVE